MGVALGGRNIIINCALSHYTLWQKIVETNRNMLVMEDDITFSSQFADRLGYLLLDLENRSFDWDIVFLGFHGHEVNSDAHGLARTFLTDTFSRQDLVSYQYMTRYGTKADASGLHGGGTFGYLLSPWGAKKLLNMVKTQKIYFPQDYQILECGLRFGLKILVCPHQLITSPKFGVDTMDSDVQKS